MTGLFARESAIDLLIFMYKEVAFKGNNNFYIRYLEKEGHHTQSNIYASIFFIEKIKLVSTQKKGRIKIVKLTEKGNEVGKRLYEIAKMIK